MPGFHIADLQKPWRRIRARAELEDVRIHDLRHSYATTVLAIGESLSMTGNLLGRFRLPPDTLTSPGTQSRPQRPGLPEASEGTCCP